MPGVSSIKRRPAPAVGILIFAAVALVVGCSMTQDRGSSAGKADLMSGSDPKAGVSDPRPLASGAQRGRELFDTVGCMGCHKINGKGGSVGPDLSNEANKGKSRQWFATQIRDPKANDPSTIMPAFDNLSEEKVNDLVDYLMTLSTEKSSRQQTSGRQSATADGSDSMSTSQQVSLSKAGETWSDMCGRCHNLRAPSEYSDAQWTVAVDQMRLLVPLTGEEQRQVLEFLKASN